MAKRCAFCYSGEEDRTPVEGWIEVHQRYMDHQPHPDRLDGLIECDRTVFEDETWFAVMEREPLAEGHVRLICKHHLTDLGQLRGPTDAEVDQTDIDAVRANLIDDLIIAHDVVLSYDDRVEDVVIISGTEEGAHLYFDIVPRYRFQHGTLHALGETSAIFQDISLPEKRHFWESHIEDFRETGGRLREAAGKVIRGRPGRRRAGLVAGDEQ